ncbi:MAG: TPM domain-containing protein [Treponema sp.]|nr:TPM domain-containing protein [Treponema sp.]
MKTSTMLKRLSLSKEDLEEIKDAVQKAEMNTTGEIQTAIASESAHYSFWELLASVCVGAFVFAILIPFAGVIGSFIEKFSWVRHEWEVSAYCGAFSFACILFSFYIFNIPFFDRIVIPKRVMKRCVTHRAFRFFAESGVYDTENHSGILIFVSYLEREVRIIADRGIAEKISLDLWKLISDELSSEIKSGNVKQGFINAIEKCGNLLAEKFPAKKDNLNELQDALIILEDAEWF